MNLNILKPRKALNPSYLKVKPERSNIENFKRNLIKLIERINNAESEEFHKNLVADFLKDTYYSPNHFINTKGRNDLVIHNSKDAKSDVGVIIEAKSPTNKYEMISIDNINVKAFQELVLYYLRERITEKNLEIKHLIVTNIYEWFIFDANVFESYFIHNKSLMKQFSDFEEKRLSGTNTDFFYKEIAKPAIDYISGEIKFTHFDIRDFDKPLRNVDKKDDYLLIALYKLLSPEHLLKLPFINDSNTLDKTFYAELLHIIGLSEIKEGSKKLILRNKEENRNQGSLIESAFTQLESLDKISRLDKPEQFGSNYEEQLFNIAIELSIIWINRILFLKLLEAQLLKYNKGDKAFSFLNSDKIKNFDDLNMLFFNVLARKPDERKENEKTLFANVPYLNSSLFEPTEIEHSCLFISQLKDEFLPILSSTVLKDNKGKKRSGKLNNLEYIFTFLDAYDFSSEGSEDIQEENKTLINASVLGLIFEKINGYKEGSFFTPGFITMYMCRETILRAVIQKFNDDKGWDCVDIKDLYNKIDEPKEANDIINSIKICDPAVGSGHFLVSALNQIIALKSELGVLIDSDGKKIKDIDIKVVNDELIITDEDGNFFEYYPKNRESQRIQQTLFHEKETLIENCLFGVDINSNSVKICRLRLWIELLKNAYYKENNVLETLPNIDINIKCGNSLINRFPIDSDFKQPGKKSKWTVNSYKIAVQQYREAKSKEQKRDMINLINTIKNEFQTGISRNNPKIKELNRKRNELYNRFSGSFLFEKEAHYGENEKKLEKRREQEKKELEKEIDILTKEIQEIKNNKIFENAFEWRFEFPEVLDNEGNYIGFDLIIGNPPYGVSIKDEYRNYLVNYLGKVPDFEIYYWFINRAKDILKNKGFLSLIIPNSILFNVFAQNYRLQLFQNWHFNEILDCTDFDIFSEATVRNIILSLTKFKNGDAIYYRNTNNVNSFLELISRDIEKIDKDICEKNNQNWALLFKLPQEITKVISKIKSNSKSLIQYFPNTSQGLIAYDKYKGQSEEIIKNRIYHSFTKSEEYNKKWLYGEDVTRYSVNWNNKEYINYCDGIANPREPKYFKGKRILVREITNPGIFSAITDEELYNDPAIIIVLDNSKSTLSLECVLGILNSNLATFYHFNSSPKATKGAFPKILVYDINNFPLPKEINKNQNNKIESLVNKILSAKQSDLHADTSEFENQINQLIYKLYNLTEEEIKIIES